MVSREWHIRGWKRTRCGLLPSGNINVEGDDVTMDQLSTDHDTSHTIDGLIQGLRGQDTSAAARILEREADDVIAAVLERLHGPQVLDLLKWLPPDRVNTVRAAVTADKLEQWEVNARYPERSIGRAMELPVGVMNANTTVADATEQLRQAVQKAFITYLYVTDEQDKLIGVVVMREMLLADHNQKLADIMLGDPFSFSPDMSVSDAMKLGVARHFPVYPVCNEQGRLIGLIRGENLFEQNVFEIVVQAGSMVGVEKEERASTPWLRSLKMRHPWLQINLLTAFVAGAVVGIFEETIDQVVVLAVFLPVLAGQSGNTGCQALAVTLRGLTLGDLAEDAPGKMVWKEAFLGLLNGAIVGLVAGAVMYWYAYNAGNPAALSLSLVVVLAMVGSCVASGVFGTLIPIVLKKTGADPATASSIFLTTATDVISMGLLLGLASVLVL